MHKRTWTKKLNMKKNVKLIIYGCINHSKDSDFSDLLLGTSGGLRGHSSSWFLMILAMWIRLDYGMVMASLPDLGAQANLHLGLLMIFFIDMVSHHFTLALASYLVSIPMEVDRVEGLKRACPESWCSAEASCSPMCGPGSPISVSLFLQTLPAQKVSKQRKGTKSLVLHSWNYCSFLLYWYQAPKSPAKHSAFDHT